MRIKETLFGISVFTFAIGCGSGTPTPESNLAGIAITCPIIAPPRSCAPVQVYNLGHIQWWASAEYTDCYGNTQKVFSRDEPGGDVVMPAFCALVGSELNIGPIGTSTNASSRQYGRVRTGSSVKILSHLLVAITDNSHLLKHSKPKSGELLL